MLTNYSAAVIASAVAVMGSAPPSDSSLKHFQKVASDGTENYDLAFNLALGVYHTGANYPLASSLFAECEANCRATLRENDATAKEIEAEVRPIKAMIACCEGRGGELDKARRTLQSLLNSAGGEKGVVEGERAKRALKQRCASASRTKNRLYCRANRITHFVRILSWHLALRARCSPEEQPKHCGWGGSVLDWDESSNSCFDGGGDGEEGQEGRRGKQ